jgi:hypothetical protein
MVSPSPEDTIMKRYTPKSPELISYLAEMIEPAKANIGMIAQEPIPADALNILMANGDVVYGYWPEPDPTKHNIGGYGVAVLKGQAILDKRREPGEEVDLVSVPVMFREKAEAHAAWQVFGEGRTLHS